MKDKISQLEIYKGIRKTWNINPVEKVIPNKKKQKRNKQILKKIIEEEGY